MNNILRELGDGWMLQVDALRSASPGYCPEGHFPDTTSRIIDEERRQQFMREGQHYETEYFLTATYLPATLAERRIQPWLFAGLSKGGKRRCAKSARCIHSRGRFARRPAEVAIDSHKAVQPGPQ